jgi:hypothetical protein
MSVSSTVLRVAIGALVAFVVFAGAPAYAGTIGDQISVYGEENAKGYLNPLVDAFAADLNSGLYHSAYIPSSGVKFSFEIQLMSVFYGDSDRTFEAGVPVGFTPLNPNVQSYTVPTVAGSGEAVTVPGQGGTQFTFPGGLSLNSFAIGVPQIRIGGFAGFEALVRFFALNTGDAELGDIKLFGLQARYSVSQHFGPTPAIDVAVGAAWQMFEMGADNFTETKSFSFGAQASKRFGILQPYGGVSWDNFTMDVTYDSTVGGTPQRQTIKFDAENRVKGTIGLAVFLGPLSGWADYNVSEFNSVTAGIGIGN